MYFIRIRSICLNIVKPIGVIKAQRASIHSTNEAILPNVRPYAEIPGLSGVPILGSMHHHMPVIGTIGPQKTFYDLAKILYEKYGPIVKMDAMLGRVNMVLLYDPEDFSQVYRAEETLPSRPGFQTSIYFRTEHKKSVYGGVYGLTTAEGAQWRDFRTKVNPIFLKPKLVKLYTQPLNEIAEDMVSRLLKLSQDSTQLNKTFDDEITKWSLESVAYVGLGTRVGCLKDNLTKDDPAMILITCAKDILAYSWELDFKPSLWKYISTPTFKKLMNTYEQQWDTSAMFIMEAKRRINERGHDIPDEDKSIIEKLLAVDEKVAIMMANEMLLAGIETVGFTTTSLLYNLAVNPRVQDRLREEIRSAPSNRYLRACIKESLRTHPVVPANVRRTTKNHVVSNYQIPPGVDVLSPNEFLSKSEKHYTRPLEFIPERWIVDKTDPLYYGNAHPMVTQPFGFGVRTCIGRRIAELEIEILIQNLIGNMKVSWTGPPAQVVTTVMNMFEQPYHFKFEPLK